MTVTFDGNFRIARYGEILAFDSSSFKTGKIGHLLKNGVWFDVIQTIEDRVLSHTLLLHQNSLNIVGSIIYRIIQPQMLLLQDVRIEDGYSGRGLISETILFVERGMNYHILYDIKNSDTKLLVDSLVSSSHFDRMLMFTPEQKVFKIQDIARGHTRIFESKVLDPDGDENSRKINSSWYHCLVSKKIIRTEQEGSFYCFEPTYGCHLDITSDMQPYTRMFDSDI